MARARIYDTSAALEARRWPYSPPSMKERIFNAVLYALVTSIAVAGVIMAIVSAIRTPAAITYGEDEVQTGRDAYCPGDVIAIEIDAQVNIAPAIIVRSDTIWSVDRDRTIVFDDDPLYSNFTKKTRVRRHLYYTLPQIPPGRYEYRSVAQTFSQRAESITLAFLVPSDCPPNPNAPQIDISGRIIR